MGKAKRNRENRQGKTNRYHKNAERFSRYYVIAKMCNEESDPPFKVFDELKTVGFTFVSNGLTKTFDIDGGAIGVRHNVYAVYEDEVRNNLIIISSLCSDKNNMPNVNTAEEYFNWINEYASNISQDMINNCIIGTMDEKNKAIIILGGGGDPLMMYKADIDTAVASSMTDYELLSSYIDAL